VFVLTYTVVVLTCFVMCGCDYVWLFSNMYACTSIYCVLHSLYCVFLYCFVYVYLFLFVLSVLVYGLLPPSDNSMAVSSSSSSSNNNNNNNNPSKTKLLLMNIELISQTSPAL